MKKSNKSVEEKSVGMPQEIERELISPSSTNPRKQIGKEELNELAQSIKDHGLLCPISVRPAGGGRYEIIAGERRWRACGLIGKERIACVVHEVSALKALELQMVENLQRVDLTPVEEARGYQMMLGLEVDGRAIYSKAGLAEKIGKSDKFLSRRLALLNLPPAALDALSSGRIGEGVAYEIARIPSSAAREECVELVLNPEYQTHALTLAQVEDLIEERFVRDLGKAPFAVEALDADRSCVGCSDCLRRNGREMCLDVDCYDRKAVAYWEKAVATAKAAGMEVLDPSLCARIYSGYEGFNRSVGYLALDMKVPAFMLNAEMEQPFWGDVLLGFEGQRFLGRDGNGRAHELVIMLDAMRFLRGKKGVPIASKFLGVEEPESESDDDGGAGEECAAPRSGLSVWEESEKIKELHLEYCVEAAVLRLAQGGKVTGELCAEVASLLARRCDSLDRFLSRHDESVDEDADLVESVCDLVRYHDGDQNAQLRLIIELLIEYVKFSDIEPRECLRGLFELLAVPSDSIHRGVVRLVQDGDSALKLKKRKGVALTAMPEHCTEKVLRSWLLRYHTASAGMDWSEVEREPELLEAFLAWVGDVKNEAMVIQFREGL